jgi:predicted DNA-binding transcriptional regulator AlpA
MRTPTHMQREAARRLGEALLDFALAIGENTPAALPPPSPPVQAPPPELSSRGDKDQPLLLRAREAAKALGVSERTLWSRTKPRGPIPSVRLGSAVCYSVAALQEWIDAEVQKQNRGTP